MPSLYLISLMVQVPEVMFLKWTIMEQFNTSSLIKWVKTTTLLTQLFLLLANKGRASQWVIGLRLFVMATSIIIK